MAISSIRDLLSSSAGRAGIRTSVNAAMIVEAANRILPTYLPGNRVRDARAVSFKSGTLTIQLRSAAARFALRDYTEDLSDKLNHELVGDPVKKVRMRISHDPYRPTV